MLCSADCLARLSFSQFVLEFLQVEMQKGRPTLGHSAPSWRGHGLLNPQKPRKETIEQKPLLIGLTLCREGILRIVGLGLWPPLSLWTHGPSLHSTLFFTLSDYN